MEQVGQASSVTSGTFDILSPHDLPRQIRLLALNIVVATEVEVAFMLHPSLEFVDEDDVSLSQETVNSLLNTFFDLWYQVWYFVPFHWN